ncbi:TPA: hypothetical protein DCE37_05250, partial [Candidatus Latescibacteria bacterium]|nr:hypothetical protein [Candidatus Latescibacterota bacterium]
MSQKPLEPPRRKNTKKPRKTRIGRVERIEVPTTLVLASKVSERESIGNRVIEELERMSDGGCG